MSTEKIVDGFNICPHLKMVFRHKGSSVLKMVTMVDRYYCELIEKGEPCITELPSNSGAGVQIIGRRVAKIVEAQGKSPDKNFEDFYGLCIVANILVCGVAEHKVS